MSAINNKLIKQSESMARKARPFIFKHGGKIYSGNFDMKKYGYDIFEDGFLLMTYNCKSASIAKKWLVDYLNN